MSAGRGSIAVLGTALAGLGHAGGATEQEIIARASVQAVARSGLKIADIDGIITSSLTSPWWVMRMAEYLGIRPPAVNRQTKSGFRDEHIAAHGFKRRTSRIRRNLVVTAGHPSLAAVMQTHLG